MVPCGYLKAVRSVRDIPYDGSLRRLESAPQRHALAEAPESNPPRKEEGSSAQGSLAVELISQQPGGARGPPRAEERARREARRGEQRTGQDDRRGHGAHPGHCFVHSKRPRCRYLKALFAELLAGCTKVLGDVTGCGGDDQVTIRCT
ncbi:hypothetical protein HPB48_003600 [Haemaphysalis longicornis]|uniref:Uncharacterized protein n=1 Tax=Haemaphysalis longicornis TaxID=44386 RepID=A0A9J6FDC2_HAELO|nr:hypothetical protein HPB48_003600 [Haemaphysalis longicornis]